MRLCIRPSTVAVPRPTGVFVCAFVVPDENASSLRDEVAAGAARVSAHVYAREYAQGSATFEREIGFSFLDEEGRESAWLETKGALSNCTKRCD